MRASSTFRANKNNLRHVHKQQMASRVNPLSDFLGEKYIRVFWVGLLEGDGDITINFDHESRRVKGFSFSIEMNYTPQTEVMLHAIAKVLEGGVLLTRKKDASSGKRKLMIRWKLESRYEVARLLKILEVFPPLTKNSRWRRDWVKSVFHKKYIENADSLDVYLFALALRNILEENTDSFSPKDYNVPYLRPWLSGFMEAESSWSATIPAKFNLIQANEKAFLRFIGQYFGTAKPYIYSRKDGVDTLHLQSRKSLKLRHDHVHANPLLGYKGVQFEAFFEAVRPRPTHKINGELITFDIPKDSLFVKIREHPKIYR